MCKDFDDYNKNHGDFCLRWQMSWTLLALYVKILNYEFMTRMQQLTEYIQSVCCACADSCNRGVFFLKKKIH